MVMCKNAVQVPGRLVYVLSGVFSTLNFPSFPGTYPTMDVFIELENLFENEDIRFAINTGDDSYRCTVAKPAVYPDGRPSYVASFSNLIFPGPGEFVVSAADSSNHLLAQRTIYVVRSAQ
jgi:hypothetical protein